MHSMRRKLFGLLMVAMMGVVLSPVWAQETAGDYLTEIGIKAGRGLLNVITSPADLPCTVRDEIQDRGAGGFWSGTDKGVAFMLRRILVGVTEIGTFVIPAPRTIPPVCQKSTAAIG